MGQNGVEDSEQTLEDKGLGTEKFAVDFAVFGVCVGGAGEGGAAAFFAAFWSAGVREEDLVLAGGVVGGEVGGEDEVFGVVGKVVGAWYIAASEFVSQDEGCDGGLRTDFSWWWFSCRR